MNWPAQLERTPLAKLACDRNHLIVMIDVVEHIVSELKLAEAMQNVKRCLAPNGLFVVSGLKDRSKKYLFHCRGWSADDVIREFPGYSIKGPFSFRAGGMLIIRNVTQ